MASINVSNDLDSIKIEDLEKKFGEIVGKIRGIVQKKKDIKDLSEDERTSLRNLYIDAANIANQIKNRTTDEEKQNEYSLKFEKLSKKAKEYGSVIKVEIPKTTMDDVKGLSNVKDLINNFIFIATRDNIIKTYGLEGGMGILMYGPPGTGKTMIAEAIANAMQLPLFTLTPADIFKSYVGESEQAVKEVFDQIELCKEGAILFVDECESIFSKRKESSQDYKQAVTTELLQRMNGFGVNGSRRIMIAATNRPDQIDPAYLRFKRFSHQIYITLPDAEAKRSIIEKKLPKVDNKYFLSDDCTVDWILGKFCEPGMNYSAADICGVIESVCLKAINKMRDLKTENLIPLSRDMFVEALKENLPRTSEEDIRMYEKFGTKEN